MQLPSLFKWSRNYYTVATVNAYSEKLQIGSRTVFVDLFVRLYLNAILVFNVIRELKVYSLT